MMRAQPNVRTAAGRGPTAENEKAEQLSNKRSAAQRLGLIEACVGLEADGPPPLPTETPLTPHATLDVPLPPRQSVPRRVWERDDAYPHLVVVGELRVIECKDGIQWILQRRRAGGTWADLGYFRNRDVLIERSGLDVTELRELPPYHLGQGDAS